MKPKPTYAQLIAKSSPAVKKLANGVRKIARSCGPKVEERVSLGWKCSWYSFDGSMKRAFCIIGVLPQRVNVFVSRKVKDPSKWLEGTSPVMAHIKVHDPKILKNPVLKRMIKQSAALQK